MCRTLDLNLSQYFCYNELKLMVWFIKKEYYLSKFINKMNLFKIVEITTVYKNYVSFHFR